MRTDYFECCHHCVAPKRYPGCSGSCPEYKEARARFDADKAKKNESLSVKSYMRDKYLENKDGVAKYMKRRPQRRFHHN